jgi:copper homeostasis protein
VNRRCFLLEACVDSVESAVAAERGGAGRLELCADLLEGGITPSMGMIATVRSRVHLPLHVIIRPRGGDFLYSAEEFDVMRRDIQHAREAGGDGVVFGLLTAHGSVDSERTAALVALARPLRITFHRAFDMARDPHAALEMLITLGIERVLTSGQEQTALEGLDLIAALVAEAGKRIVVMPGGGIHERNVGKIVAQSGVREVHVSARTMSDSAMEYRNPRAYMGGELRPPEFARSVADAARIQAIIQAATR